MIRADEQRLSRPDAMGGIVRKHENRPAADRAAVPQNREVDIKRDLPQRYHDAQVRQQSQLPLQETTAAPNLLRRGLVTRGSATDRRRNIGAGQPQSILTRNAIGLR